MDEIPVLADQTKEDDGGGDKTYRPPKHSNALHDEAPGSIYGSDGELTSETECGRELVSMSVFTLLVPLVVRYWKTTGAIGGLHGGSSCGLSPDQRMPSQLSLSEL